jgi:hypothetical protein
MDDASFRGDANRAEPELRDNYRVLDGFWDEIRGQVRGKDLRNLE